VNPSRAIPALIAVLILAAPVAADQYNKRLPGLLDQLQSAETATEAQVLERRIWRVWIHHDDAEVSRYMSIGISAMNGGNLEVAFAAFDQVVGLAPDFAEGWNKRATVYYMMEKLDASMLDIERTLALEPRHFGALSGMGLIFDAIGNHKAAADAWERALAVNPHIPGAREHIEELRKRDKGQPI
jgi:tetratricopeptide (TPR) repeat protein